MNPFARLMAWLDRSFRAVLVIGLTKAARLLTRTGVRLYVHGCLSGVEIRLLLGISSAINRTSIRLLRPAKK